jgi:hypothetical protein
MTERDAAARDADDRAHARHLAGWLTGSDYHKREARRLAAWAHFLRTGIAT